MNAALEIEQPLENNSQIGVFPAPTISQLEEALEERQQPDRRKRQQAIDFDDRRTVVRRQSDRCN